jgi:hypothetical protein
MYNIKSRIYTFDEVSSKFTLFQEIDTLGAQDWEAFTVGSTTYLAVANFNSGVSYNVKSRIYTPNPSTKKFELFQEIDTSGAVDWEAFVVGSTTYLAVANSYNGSSYNVKSRIYTLNPSTMRFELLQEIDTIGAQDWEAFTINGSTYLAVANSKSGQASNLKSSIYVFSPAIQRFDLFQEIDTSGAQAWKAFVMAGTSYLAVANSNDGSSFNVRSRIYKFESIVSRFVPFQEVDTSDASEWEAFSFNGAMHLAVANHYNGLTTNIKSSIYRFDPAVQRFEFLQGVDTNGALSWKAFVMAGTSYLAIANQYDGEVYNIPSRIYKLGTWC